MKVALAQMEVKPNQPRNNLDTILEQIDSAKREGADLVVFPEMAVGGYLLGDKWLDESFCNDLMSYNEDIKNASQGIAVAWGNIYVDPNDDINQRISDVTGTIEDGWHPNKDGRHRKYNAIYVAQNGEYVSHANGLDETGILPKGVQPKTLLPNYRIFDDERYFFSLQDVAKDFDKPLENLVQPFEIEINGEKKRIGFETCEDLWCSDYRAKGEAINPTKYLINNGAELIVNSSSSPWTFGKNGARDRRVEFLKQDIGDNFVPFLYTNCVGAQNNGKNIVTFDGGTTAYNKDGKPVVFNNNAYQNSLTIVDNDSLSGKPIERVEKPKVAQKYDALIRGIKHISDNFGNDPKYVIGLSGGIDSAVVACLLEQAVGSNKILGVNMPTEYNSMKTKLAAKSLAYELGIWYQEIPIGDLVDTNAKLLEGHDYVTGNTGISELAMENIQAKIRGTSILSNLAGMNGALFTNNGNKLETALGYATLYGDVGGAIAPIGDLTKTEVFELAKYLNKEVYDREVIPNSLIPDELYRFGKDQIAPTAELKEAQIDPMKFGYHDALLDKYTDFKKSSAENVLEWYIDGTLESKLGVSNDLIVRWGIDSPKEFVKDLEWFDGKIQQNVFKRIQSPPNIITSKSAYGYDIRESQLPVSRTRKYEELKSEVLAMGKYTPRDK